MNPDWNSPLPSLLSYPISTPASTKEVASGVLVIKDINTGARRYVTPLLTSKVPPEQ